MLIYLHGVSSSGKTTIGNALLNYLDNAILIDQDSYYKKIKPQVTFTGDKIYTVSNWDTAEAIDFNALNKQIEEALKQYTFIIVTGFALRDQYMIKPDVSILLDIGVNALEKITTARQVSKGYSGEKAIRDQYMVKEVVWPYYQETLNNITYDYKIDVFKENNRKLLKDLVLEILKMIIFL